MPRRIEHAPTIPVQFPSDIDFPDYDGLPMADNTDQAFEMTSAYHTLLDFFWERNDVFVATNLLVYYREGDNQARITPDVMVAVGRPQGYRGSYKVWEEGQHPPDWVLEVASEESVEMDVLQKPGTYAGIGVREFWQYDPTGGLLNPRLQGWRLSGLRYTELPQVPVAGAEIAIDCEVLGLRLEFDGEQLRFWNPTDERYLRTPLESEQAIRELERATLESGRATRELERQVEATKARTNAAVRSKQELRALVADLPAGSQPPDGSAD